MVVVELNKIIVWFSEKLIGAIPSELIGGVLNIVVLLISANDWGNQKTVNRFPWAYNWVVRFNSATTRLDKVGPHNGAISDCDKLPGLSHSLTGSQPIKMRASHDRQRNHTKEDSSRFL